MSLLGSFVTSFETITRLIPFKSGPKISETESTNVKDVLNIA
jgi:hypothetical protein